MLFKKLIKLVKNLPRVKEFFVQKPHGYANIPLPDNILIFARSGIADNRGHGALHHRYLLNFNLGTPCELVIGRQSFLLPGNSVFLIQPYENHLFIHNDAGISRLMITFETTAPELLPEIHLPVELTPEILDAACALLRVYSAGEAENWELTLRLTLLLHTIKKAQSSGLIVKKTLEGPSFSRKVVEYIARNLHRKFSLASLAKEFHISVTHLRRRFLQETGITPGEYILHCRINQAIIYLGKAEYNISEIAERCGYSGIQAFSRAFHNYTGESPQSYRQIHFRK
jgi:AraC-like DNA-binding protein